MNTDSKERLAKAIQKGNVTWNSWWDGGDTYGPIASKWNVKSWPTIYLIDKKGVIRYKGHKEDFDELLTELLI